MIKWIDKEALAWAPTVSSMSGFSIFIGSEKEAPACAFVTAESREVHIFDLVEIETVKKEVREILKVLGKSTFGGSYARHQTEAVVDLGRGYDALREQGP